MVLNNRLVAGSSPAGATKFSLSYQQYIHRKSL
uniref:Uncharacterized protein n=1 Tax=Peduovirinae sp. ctjOQ18 TaxID=2825161 RepID=A0A8S5P1L7_9CAUD|nr:MAG TPA: hypothetical protein [Peduovirinae sp. ctjOQ18]